MPEPRSRAHLRVLVVFPPTLPTGRWLRVCEGLTAERWFEELTEDRWQITDPPPSEDDPLDPLTEGDWLM